jgi:hypothetical protein
MKGGSGYYNGCGSCGCPIAPFSFEQMNKFGLGGSNVMSGTPILGIGQNGGFYKQPSHLPGPYVGEAWNTDPRMWPGADGISSGRNYLANYGSVIQNDPALQMKLNSQTVGGRRKKLKGGTSIIPQDIATLGSDIYSNFKNVSNALNGYPIGPPIQPYLGQYPNTINSKIIV